MEHKNKVEKPNCLQDISDGINNIPAFNNTACEVDNNNLPIVLRDDNHLQEAEESIKQDNSFSLKHFLCQDQSMFNHKGARPKIYQNGIPVVATCSPSVSYYSEQKAQRCSNSPILSNSRHAHKENPATLPDFVQDHLVVEQCYLNRPDTTSVSSLSSGQNIINGAHNNLPDFTLSGPEVGVKVQNTSSTGRTRDESVPMDLPLNSTREPEYQRNWHANGGNVIHVGNKPKVPKSLPDFLNDGAVQSSQASTSSCNNDMREVNSNSTYQTNTDGSDIREELRITKQTLFKQNEHIEFLNREITLLQDKCHHLRRSATYVNHFDDELSLMNGHNTGSSNESQLKSDNQKLIQQIQLLQKENRKLRKECRSKHPVGVAACSKEELPLNQSNQLARDLRAAANSAEFSLRQLLHGVENLRTMAKSLEECDSRYETLEDDEHTPVLNLE